MSWLSEGHNSGWRERVGPTYSQHKIYTAFQLVLIYSAIQELTDFTLVFAFCSLFLHILANCLFLLSLQPSLAYGESDGPEGQWERWAQADHKVQFQKNADSKWEIEPPLQTGDRLLYDAELKFLNLKSSND